MTASTVHLVQPPTDHGDDIDFARRFGGLQRLYGVDGAQKIYGAHVAVVGIGGVGSWAAESLARSGVGRLTLIDLDHVAESNINRQIHALSTTLGQSKTDAMRQRIALINPHCVVTCIEDFVEPANWPDILPSDVHGVMDCCDQTAAKVAMSAWARTSKSLFITVGAAGGKRHAHRVEIEDLVFATHDPLLARLRNQLRKKHGAPPAGRKIGIPCVFSREPVAPPNPSCAVEGDGTLNCSGYGSLVAVTATFGQCAAGWMLDAIERRH